MIALLFDTETTGLIDNHKVKLNRQPHIIEFYSCVADLENGEILSEIDQLIRPPKQEDLIEKITDITGISWDMVKDKPIFAEVAPKIIEAIEVYQIVIAHNLSFDMEMMDLEAERIGRKIAWPRRKICTVEQSIWVKGHRLNLSALHQMLFVEAFTGAHRAKQDVMATLRCCVEMHKRGWI
jgi:DNA polymerase III alpha subunit (gram-positive type)